MVDFDKFKDVDVQILGISVDDSFSQKTFADSLGLPFPILSDMGGDITKLYAADKLIKAGTDLSPFMAPGTGVTLKEDRVGASQAFFLVDKQGILRGRWLPGDAHPFASEKILKMATKWADK